MFKWVLMLSLISLSACDYYVVNPYHHALGHIPKDKAITDPEFKVCFDEHIFDYYIFRKPAKFRFGKDSLRNYFLDQYDAHGIINDSGYITIRFVINCYGQAGRFMITELGLDYQEKSFNKKTVKQILTLLQNANSWNPSLRGDIPNDSYLYYTFKIINGELVEILP